MNYNEVLEAARPRMGLYCKACHECNGHACGSRMPGPGAKGVGDGAIRNYEAWKAIHLCMDTITENRPVETKRTLFGKEFALPIFAGPVGAVNQHYGDSYTDLSYNEVLVAACAAAGIAAFTGDGADPAVMCAATEAIGKAGGMGVPTVKPWDAETIRQKLAQAQQSGAFAYAMDVDAIGLPFLQNRQPPAGAKTVVELKEIIAGAGKPFIVKGIMTVKGALKAKEAGAAAIVVSNHGGRVLDGCCATAEVLPAIAEAVGGSMTVLVDGGLRSGTDVFKALALGADGVLICRPFVTAVYGAGAEGVGIYLQKLGNELRDAMLMCGAHSLEEITREMVTG